MIKKILVLLKYCLQFLRIYLLKSLVVTLIPLEAYYITKFKHSLNSQIEINITLFLEMVSREYTRVIHILIDFNILYHFNVTFFFYYFNLRM